MSAVSFNLELIASPAQVALVFLFISGVNTRLDHWMSELASTARYGVVVYDFPETPLSLLTRVILSNTFTQSPKVDAQTITASAQDSALRQDFALRKMSSVQESCPCCGNISNEKYIMALEHFVDTVYRGFPALERHLKH